mgnify:FL=1
MLITKKYLEGRVLQVDNCLSYAGHMNHNDLFKIQDGKFRFPHEHHGAELVQYQWPDNIPEPDVELYKKVLGLPEDCIARVGLHEINHSKYIPPHADQNHLGGLTIFMNNQWNTAWGGQGVAYDEGEWIISDVKFNTGVFYRTPIMHCTLPVYKNGQVRRTIQIFFDENDQN